ncbi:MAG: alpha/beta fold hydrolase [Firmicutes bacterium]|nr:alpha/beta fold hydrolase [Bacillota bacterium]
MYYTQVYINDTDYGTLVQPPFRVLAEMPDYGAFVEFDNDALPLLQRILGEHNAIGSICDDKCRSYKVAADSVELIKNHVSRNFKQKMPAMMRERAAIRETSKQWQEHDTAFCAGLDKSTIVQEGSVKCSSKDLRYAYGEPGAKVMLRYSLRSPKGNKDRPLLVFLHGAGGWGYDGHLSLRGAKLLRILRRQDYHMLVPQLGFTGQEIDDYNSEDFTRALCEIIGRIPNVDRNRMYIAGNSMGGYGAIMQCLRKPGFYAACLPSVAWLFDLEQCEPKDKFHRPLDDEAYDILAQTPMWLSYSRVEQSVNEPLYDALRMRGADVKRTQVNLVGHGMWNLFFTVWPWKKWMMGKRLGI